MAKKIIFIFLFGAVLTFLIAYILNSYFMENVTLAGATMEPNYKSGQTCKISKLVLSVSRGEVIVFSSPNSSKIKYFKRVVAIPNDKIEINSGDVFLNGIRLSENYIPQGVKTPLWEGGFMTQGKKIQVPANSYFVMGDNRQRSSDSRELGFVNQKDIIGTITKCN